MMLKRRTILTLAVFGLLGAAVNIAVAWAIGALIDPSMPGAFERTGSGPGGYVGDGTGYCAWIVYRHASPHAVRIRSSWTDEGVGGGHTGGWPTNPAERLVPDWASWLSPEGQVRCQSAHDVICWEYGWPMRSVGGGVEVRYRFGSSVTIGRYFALALEPSLLGNSNNYWQVRLLVYRPLWPGFVINTVFYAAICWLVFIAPFVLRRRRRIARGLCPVCAYPVGASDLCTECGKPVAPKSIEPVT